MTKEPRKFDTGINQGWEGNNQPKPKQFGNVTALWNFNRNPGPVLNLAPTFHLYSCQRQHKVGLDDTGCYKTLGNLLKTFFCTDIVVKTSASCILSTTMFIPLNYKLQKFQNETLGNCEFLHSATITRRFLSWCVAKKFKSRNFSINTQPWIPYSHPSLQNLLKKYTPYEFLEKLVATETSEVY